MFWHYAQIGILALAVIVGLSVIWSVGTKRNPWALLLICIGLIAGFFLRNKRDV